MSAIKTGSPFAANARLRMLIDPHACLACGAAHEGARMVQLHDGRSVSSYSEAWRHESEAAEILRFKTISRINEHLRLIEGHRGPAAVKQLRATMDAIERSKNADQPREAGWAF